MTLRVPSIWMEVGRAGAEPKEPLLARIAESLGPEIVRSIAGDGAVVVNEVVLADPTSDVAVETGDLLLAVAVEPTARDAWGVVRRAGRAGAAGVVFKSDEPLPERLCALAGDLGITLLGVAVDLTWDRLYGLLRTAVASNRRLGDDTILQGDLFALANALAAMVGGAVTIEDRGGRVLAYSSLDQVIDEPRKVTILGRRVPEHWAKRLHDEGLYRRLWSGEDVIRFAGSGDDQLRPRLVLGVRAGREVLGSIWVIEGDSPLGEQAERVLRDAARVAAMHMVQSQVNESFERRQRGDLLRSVFDGTAALEDVRRRLDLDPASPVTVAAFEIEAGDDAEAVLQRERTLDFVALCCEAFRRRAVCMASDRLVYALLPTDDGDGAQRVARLVGSIIEQAGTALGVRLRAGIGSVVEDIGKAPRSRSEADQVLRVLERGGGTVWATIDEVRTQTILVELRDLLHDRPHLAEGKLAALRRYDREHRSAYVDTLRAYLRSSGDLGAAAASINVHVNTLRYRLRRLGELFDVDLSDPDERFVLQFQLGADF